MQKMIVLLGALLLLSFTACGPKVPDGMPKTVPCYITVTNGGTPIANVKVILNSETGGAVTIYGETDAEGKAELVSTLSGFQQKGAPLGQFKVTLLKDANIKPKTSLEMEQMTPAESKAYQAEIKKKTDEAQKLVPVQYTTKEKTPVSVTVSADSANKELTKIDTQAK